MSEPLSSHEIEDVLSSIRRLVSEDLRPAARDAAEARAPRSAEKLLLTPSLRVVPPADADADAGAAPVAVEPDRQPEQDVAAPGGDAGTDAGLTEPSDPWAPEDRPAEAEFADVDDVVWAAPGAAVDVAEDEPEPGVVTADTIASARGHWTAETVPVPEIEWMQADAEWEEEEPLAFTAHPRAAARVEEPLAKAWADRAEAEVTAALSAGAAAARPETVTVDEDRLRPVQGRAGGPAGNGEAPADGRSGAGGGGGSGGGGGGAGGDGPGLFDAEDAMIDEEMLRDIVRDIIREELSGTLGERITRNVRKLVRVEINRALTARDFE